MDMIFIVEYLILEIMNKIKHNLNESYLQSLTEEERIREVLEFWDRMKKIV